MSVRDQIMNRVRVALRHGERPPLGSSSVSAQRPAPCDPDGLGTASAQLEHFRIMLQSVDGHYALVRDNAGAAQEVQRFLDERKLGELALSSHPQVEQVATHLKAQANPPTTFSAWEDRERLLQCPAGLTTAQFGIAETGTLILQSESDQHREASLLPPLHIALLRASDIRPTIGAALSQATANLRSTEPQRPPGHLLTLITGPSRTADIELILVVGVHGPKELAVIVIDDAS